MKDYVERDVKRYEIYTETTLRCINMNWDDIYQPQVFLSTKALNEYMDTLKVELGCMWITSKREVRKEIK